MIRIITQTQYDAIIDITREASKQIEQLKKENEQLRKENKILKNDKNILLNILNPDILGLDFPNSSVESSDQSDELFV